MAMIARRDSLETPPAYQARETAPPAYVERQAASDIVPPPATYQHPRHTPLAIPRYPDISRVARTRVFHNVYIDHISQVMETRAAAASAGDVEGGLRRPRRVVRSGRWVWLLTIGVAIFTGAAVVVTLILWARRFPSHQDGF